MKFPQKPKTVMLLMVGWDFDCPRCSPNSGKFKLGYHPNRHSLVCWTCGSIRFGDALAEITGEPLDKILQELKGLERLKLFEEKRGHGKLVLPNNLGPLLPAHRKYLKKRGFDPDELTKVWGLKGIGVDAKLPWRIWIPFVHKHRIVSWTTRSISNNGLRYITAKATEEEENHKQLLFGYDFIKNVAIIVEGPMDAFRIGPGAVATLGLGYSRGQLIKISKIPLRIILFDSEPAAQRRAKQLANDLSCFAGTTIIAELQTGKDAAEASCKEIQYLQRKFLR